MGLVLKTATLVDDFEFISSEDPAVDTSGDDFAEVWRRFLEGAGPAPIKEGQEPVIWKLRHIRGRRAREVIQDKLIRDGVGTATTFVCRWALRSVQGLKDEHGKSLKVPIEREDGMDLVTMGFLDDLETIREAGGPDLVSEIGNWGMQSKVPS